MNWIGRLCGHVPNFNINCQCTSKCCCIQEDDQDGKVHSIATQSFAPTRAEAFKDYKATKSGKKKDSKL